MCGSSSGSDSGGGTSNIVAGGRGSNIAVRKKSKASQLIQDTAAGFAGGIIGGPLGSIAAKQLSKRGNTTEINLSTGQATPGPQRQVTGSGESRNDNVIKTPVASADTGTTALTAAANEKAATEKAATEKAATVAAEEKAAAEKKKKSAGKKTKTVLAGAKIAEDKLKTKLGQ